MTATPNKHSPYAGRDRRFQPKDTMNRRFSNFRAQNYEQNHQYRHQQPQNVPYFYQDRTPSYQHSPQFFNRTPHVVKHGTHISQHFHFSMLENPWQALLERHQVIEESDLKLHERNECTESKEDEELKSAIENKEYEDGKDGLQIEKEEPANLDETEKLEPAVE